MKVLTFLAVALAVALGGFCILQTRKVQTQQAEIATAQAKAEEAAKRVEQLETSQKKLQQQRQELLQQAEDLAAQLHNQAKAAAPAAAAPAAPAAPKVAGATQKGDLDKGGLGGLLKTMMSDPDTKKLIQEQQRLMAEQLYAPLTKQLGMTPDEATQFKSLIADNMAKATEKASAMFGGTNRAEAMSQMAEDQKSFEDQVKNFLGDSRYQQYKDYQLTVGDRAQLNMFKQQTQSGEYPVTDQQTEQLLNIMKEEKQRLASSGQSVPGMNDQANIKASFGQEEADKMLASQEQVNQRVYERASTVLSPDQMQTFARYQTNQLQMLRLGFSMARKFMTPEKAGGDSAAPAE